MNTTKIIFLTVLAYVLAIAVVLSSMHARDIVANQNNGTNNIPRLVDMRPRVKPQLEDVSAKAIGELHNHVEKTMVKSMLKSTSDQAPTTRSRDSEDEVSIDRTLSIVMMELSLIFRLTFAATVAR